MRLPSRFVLLLEGDRARLLWKCSAAPYTLPHLLHHLLTGGSVDPSVFEPFGLRVTIDVDTDQGDETGPT